MEKIDIVLEIPGIEQEKTKSINVTYKRLLLYGGARKASDNSSFYYASLNVKKDYGNDGEFIHEPVNTAKSLVDIINRQEDNSIQSLDVFCHGSEVALYFIKGSSINNNITEEEVEEKDLHSPLAIGRTTNAISNWNLSGDERLISDIDYNKFTTAAKIEIHGCNTAAVVRVAFWLDNLCEDLSENLYDAGKTNSVVIGHSTKANPNLPTTKIRKGESEKAWNIRKNKEQDYRHGKRKVYNNGECILTTKKQGRITAEEIRNALSN